MPSNLKALPLNVTPASTPAKAHEMGDKTPTPPTKQTTISASSGLAPTEISSPHELTAFVRVNPLSGYLYGLTRETQVETLLEQLDSKFDEMSTQILDRSESVTLYSEFRLDWSFSEPNVVACGCPGGINTGHHQRRYCS